MKKILLLVVACLTIFSIDGYSQKRKKKQANEETKQWRYELSPESLGTQNSKVIRVWSYSKDVNVAREQATKNAVHGVVFQGVQADKEKRITAVLPLVKSIAVKNQYSAFFEDFFSEGGDYRRFVNTTNVSDKIRKIEKKMYKVGVVVNVDYSALRTFLEENGVVKKMSSGF